MVIIFVFFILLGKFKDPFLLVLVSLALALLVSTILNHSSKFIWLQDWAPYLAAALLVATLVKPHPKALLCGLLFATAGMSVPNIISIALFPYGIYEPSVYFYGNRNIAYQLSFISILCALLLSLRFGKKFLPLSIIGILIAITQIVLAHSATTYIASVFLCIGLLLACSKIGRKAFNGLTVLGGTLLLFLLIICFHIQNYMEPLITGVLGKHLDLSGRTDVWDLTFELLRNDHIWLGYGINGNERLVIDGIHFNHAHNMYLDICFMGGILALAIFLLLITKTAKCLYRNRNSTYAAVLTAMLGAYLIVGLSEPMTRVSFFIMLSLCYYLPAQYCENKSDTQIHESKSGDETPTIV